jgi:glycosyltransferase involved in cell wall biosynthesis
MKVLLLCDRPSWAYDSIARSLVRHNHDPSLELDVFHLKRREDELRKRARRYDSVFALGWQLLGTLEGGAVRETLSFLRPARTLTGIHSHHAFDDGRTLPDRDVPPPPALIEFLRRYRRVNAVSRRLARLFSAAGLSDVSYTPNGVDTDLFRPLRPISGTPPLRVGFSGSRKHDWRKGVSEFITPAASLDGVELHVAMPAEGKHVPQDRMPAFYNQIDVYVCASSSEGFSLSLLEAAATGRPLVSTRVGGSEELIEEGVNGFFVDRTVEAIREKLLLLRDDRELARRMGEASRRIVEERWSWTLRAPAWLRFIRESTLQAGLPTAGWFERAASRLGLGSRRSMPRELR